MGVQINGDTGNVIATKGTYSGNVTIGGTLTYEDVTNIDSVGLITARNGIVVGSGITLSKDGDIFATGVTTTTHTIVNTTASNKGLIINATGSNYPSVTGNAARTGADEFLLNIRGLWNDQIVANIILETGSDTTNKDDGVITFRTASAGSPEERLRIDSSGKIGIATQSPTGYLSVGKVGGYLNADGITVTNPHSSGLKNGVFVLNESGYNATASYRAAAFKAVGTAGFGIGISTDQGSNGLGGTLNYSMTFDGKSNQNGSITANGSFYQEDTNTSGGDALDKTIEFNRRGVFLMLISFSLGTTTTDINRNVYSLGLFTSRSNGATWTAIQQDLSSTHVGNLTISDNSVRGQLRVQKAAGSDDRACAFRIDVLSSADVAITVTDT